MKKCFFYRFSWLKWLLIRDFFKLDETCERIVKVKSLEDAKNKGISSKDSLYFWGKKLDKLLINWAHSEHVPIFYIEDGFLRSVGLGSALSKPYSLVVDSRGIYFDPNEPSDLEYILENHDFNEKELSDAAELIQAIQESRLSKYNHQCDEQNLILDNKPKQKIILVPGQVDDDMSVLFGGFGLNNMTLLKKVREEHPEEFIIYKPHPDVLSKNRIGDLPDEIPLQWADRVIKGVSIDSVIAVSDEVHTMTSLVGFDALLRGKIVFTYGLPFYAGWGLTTDVQSCERRNRHLNLLELVAATLIIYPRYLHPKSNQPGNVFEVLEFLANEKKLLESSKLRRTILHIKGTFLPLIRNVIKKL